MRSITRVLLIAFMVALLPVRGWIGDAMAVEMAADAANATKYVAQERHSTPASGSIASKNAPQARSDCAGHGSMAQADNPQAASTQATDACQGCSACQVCHTLALAVVSAGTEPTDWAQAVPSMAKRHFSSADSARGFKPPIS